MTGKHAQGRPGKWNPVPKSFSYQWARCTDCGTRVRPDRRRDRRDPRGGARRSRSCARGDRAGPRRRDVAGRLQRGDRTCRRQRQPPRPPPRRRDGDWSVELRAARCRFRDPAGQAADRRRGVVVRLRGDQVRLPVAPLRHGRCALQVDQRRDGSHVHARRQGRGADGRFRGARDRQDGNDERRTRVSSDRSRDRTPSSSQPASRRSSVRPRRVRRSRSRPAAGARLRPRSGTSGSAATRTGDSASRFPEPPRAPTP